MYDEPWIMAAKIKQLVYLTTGGNEMNFDWSAFYVRAQPDPDVAAAEGVDSGSDTDAGSGLTAKAGWPPHRDRGNDSTATEGFRQDGTPRYATFLDGTHRCHT
jgi:hypothetical protein